MAVFTLIYAVVQTKDFFLVLSPDVVRLDSRFDLRFSEALSFEDNQFNIGIEFV